MENHAIKRITYKISDQSDDKLGQDMVGKVVKK